MSKNLSKLSARKGLGENLFEQIKRASTSTSNSDTTSSLADRFLVGKSSISGVKTFYDFLSNETPHAGQQKIRARVCLGTSCLCSGDPSRVRASLEAVLGPGEVGSVTCLGHCYHADSYHYQGKNYSGLGKDYAIAQEITQESAQESAQENAQPVASAAGRQDSSAADFAARCISDTCILTDQHFSTRAHLATALQTLSNKSKKEILNSIKASGLRGRGGAGFPAGLKWESCAQAESDTRYIVCNADEGDPGAFSDRYLLEEQPLRVIFGMMVAAWIVNAKEGVIYIRAEYPNSIAIIARTIEQLKEHGLLGDNIPGLNMDFDLKVIEGAGSYICGEETALIASIEGRRPEVDVRPPFPTEQGLYRKPTLLNNVETFAAVQRILELGGDAYSRLGTEKSTGTKLISLDAGFSQPGIVEAEMGMPLKTLIDDVAGGFKRPVKAVHIGGPLGGLVPCSKFAELNLDFESFAEAGFLLGHAGFVSIPTDFPIIRYLAHLFEFTRDESCGKCFPCRLGSTRGHEMMVAAIDGSRLLNRTLLNDLLETMEKGSLCALGGGLPLPVKNALQYFADELQGYFETDKTIPVRSL